MRCVELINFTNPAFSAFCVKVLDVSNVSLFLSQSPIYHLRVTKFFGTASGVQSKHDVPFSMAMLYFFWHTAREVIEATLLVKVSAKIVHHMVYSHQIQTNKNVSITMCKHMMCWGKWCPGTEVRRPSQAPTSD